MSFVYRRVLSQQHKKLNNFGFARKFSDKNFNETVKIWGDGMKPQGLKEEGYFGRQQTELFEKLKQHKISLLNKIHNEVNEDDDDDDGNELQPHSFVIREFVCPIGAINCREEEYFHQQSLDALHILKYKNKKPIRANIEAKTRN